MRKLSLLILVGLLGTGGLACWFWPDAEVGGERTSSDPGAPATNGDTPFVHASTEEASVDAGVGHVSGRVVDSDGKFVVGAVVRLYGAEPDVETLECGLCHALVLDCTDPTTAARVLAGVRDGTIKPPPVLAEVRSDEEGNFTFEGAPLGGHVVASQGSMTAESPCDAEALELTLEPAMSRIVRVMDTEGQPLPHARLTIYSPRDGTLREAAVDAEGVASVLSSDRSEWVYAEAPGLLPAAQRLEVEPNLALGPPRTLVVRTKLGGQPIDVEVKVQFHGEAKPQKTRGGVLTLEHLPSSFYTVSVAADGFAAAEQSIELAKPVTEIEFELRRGATLFVPVSTVSGEPVPVVYATLSSSDVSASVEAVDGAMVVLGPVPEGEYSLSLTADGMVPVERQLDLKPGETTLELTLRPAPRVLGTVLDAAGKPVEYARVFASEDGQEVASAASDAQGHFELELRYPGKMHLHVDHQVRGVADQDVTVPAEKVVLTLSEKGVLVAEVLDADGTALSPNVVVRSEKDGVTRWIEPDENGVARLAGLATGRYVVERQVPERLLARATADVVEGQTSKVVLRMDRGATVSGKVVDHLGKPVEGAMVMVSGRPDATSTRADGHFECSGVERGTVTIYALQHDGPSTEPLEVEAPATNVVLTVPESPLVRGRVVDEHGAPVRDFDANGKPFKTTDGRFEVRAPNKNLELYADEFAAYYSSEAVGDVGDVVLRAVGYVEGTVVDPEGKPVSGASVVGGFEGMPCVTDAGGRFKLYLSSEGPMELVATRGSLSGRAEGKLGTPARIVLQRGTAVFGRVVDATGKGVGTLVTANNALISRPVEVETDENGRFQLDLLQGVWTFSTRFNRVSRALDVRGERVEVTLGEETGSCGLQLQSTRRLMQVWLTQGASLLSGDQPLDGMVYAAGTIEVPVSGQTTEVSARGVPCGRYLLNVVGDELTGVEQWIDLRTPAQVVAVAPVRMVKDEAPSPDKELVP